MHITILHHHLNPGGVTRIIQSQVTSLKKKHSDIQIQILTGKSGFPEFFREADVDVKVNPDLDYILGHKLLPGQTQTLYERTLDFLRDQIPEGSFIHAHNLNLGKNPVLTLAVSDMNAEGYRLFNHCHDFAEDRPPNMDYFEKIIKGHFGKNPEEVMYPVRPDYLFGTLNSFDRERIIRKGIPEDQVILLPNPVHFEQQHHCNKKQAKADLCDELGLDTAKTMITYPVRVIRRKNIGEFILLAVLFEEEANWLVTQPPKNPQEITHYEQWKQLCNDLNIPVHWEVGTKVDFEKLLIGTDVCISTSIREGFGMVFLEPWLPGTPVMGRNIGYVTKDLIASGVDFPLLYDKLDVKINGTIHDFGEIDPQKQQNFIHRIRNDRSEKKKIRNMNPGLKIMFDKVTDDLIQKNQETIKAKYSLENYASRLDGIYGKLA